MKRRDLLRLLSQHAQENGLSITETEGARHTKVTVGSRRTVVPRHREINDATARSILRQIGVEP